MTEDQMLRLEAFLTTHLGDGWQMREFVSLTANQVVAALWPMNDLFRPHHAQIGTLSYSAAYEAEADQALWLLANGGTWTVAAPSAGAWRVLLERHSQCLTMALGNPKLRMTVPKALAAKHHLAVALLFFQWGMVLPFAIKDRPSPQWPAGPMPVNLLRH